MKRIHKYSLAATAAVLALAIVGFTNPSPEAWFRGIIYAGSGKVALTDATGNLSYGAGTTVTAAATAHAGGGAGSATLLAADYTVFTTVATALDSAILPAAASGKAYTVFNEGAATLAVYPATGDQIDDMTATSGYRVVNVGAAVTFRGESASQWHTMGQFVNSALDFTGATGTNFIHFPDNLANGFDIREGTNSYIKLVSTNSSEAVAFTPQAQFAAPSIYSLNGAVSAAGSSKTDATALALEYSAVTTATALQGVTLLTAAAGLHMAVYNATAVSIVVYPLDAGNDTLAVDDFSALAADAGWVLAPKAQLDCWAYTTTAWRCVSTQGARATVAGAGSSEADDTELTSVNMNASVTVTGANGAVGIALPTGAYPGCVRVMTEVTGASNTLKVYGATADDSDTINAVDGDTAFVQMAGTSLRYCTANGTDWLTY